jgi:hypothetical protein
LSIAERLAAGYGDDDPHVIGWRRELVLVTGCPGRLDAGSVHGDAR